MSKKKDKDSHLKLMLSIVSMEAYLGELMESARIVEDRLTEAVDLLKIISTQTRQSEVITVRQYDDPELQRRKVSAAQEIEAIRAEEAERYHAYRDKPLQPYVRVHEAP
ncbi:hypothetical protein SEA_GYZLAR_36 [Mycobacterium phage Gyzlar]|nr:hypothetical protein SEA_GYZLAR_36 [Mycobacterium phage Gyzlar]